VSEHVQIGDLTVPIAALVDAQTAADAARGLEIAALRAHVSELRSLLAGAIAAQCPDPTAHDHRNSPEFRPEPRETTPGGMTEAHTPVY
jgi:hypothetical protein